MVRIAVSSILCLLCQGHDESSLLQANVGKMRLHAVTTAQWVEAFARTPSEVVNRVLEMQPSEQNSLLQMFQSADAASLTKELEPHKVALALALRGSSLEGGTPSTWVSALQRSGEMEQAISTKKGPNRKKNDGKNASTFPAQLDIKGDMFDLTSGRCRTGMEYDDIDFNETCITLCDSGDTGCLAAVVEPEGLDPDSQLADVCKQFGGEHDDAGTGHGLTPSETCASLCDLDDGCDSSEFEEGVCKRFTATLKNYKRSTLQSCAKKCKKNDDCAAFEWDNGECELHDNSTDVALSEAEPIGDDHACYFRG